MDPWGAFHKDVVAVVSKAEGLAKKDVAALVERPPKGIGADLAFPCFILAKKLKRPPQELAAEISLKIAETTLIEKAEPAGPYINFYANWAALGGLLLKTVLKEKSRFGRGTQKGKIMLEFAHPNTHKAFHLGHVRNIALGESLTRVLEFAGYRVVRVNYQGDIGPHVAKCLWGLQHLRMREPEKDKGVWLGQVYAKANQAVRGDQEKEAQVKELNKRLYARDPKLTKTWKKTRKWSLEYFDSVYKDFGVRFDRLYFESEVEGPGVKLAKQLLAKKKAKESEGAVVMDLEKWNLGIYVLLTGDGTPLYSIKDFVLAGLQDKEYTPQEIMHIVGTEQILHFKQLFKSLELINPKVAKKEKHLAYALVTLKEGKMSSREGRVVTYDKLRKEVLKHALKETKKHAPHSKNPEKTAEAVGLGAVTYDMLKVSPEKTITFDWDQALSLQGNTAPYLQYTHARACSILAKESRVKTDATHLAGGAELQVLKKLASWGNQVEAAAREYRPHYVATYAHELATVFNDFYQNVPVLKAAAGVKEARLALVQATQLVLQQALTLLGVPAPEKM